MNTAALKFNLKLDARAFLRKFSYHVYNVKMTSTICFGLQVQRRKNKIPMLFIDIHIFSIPQL